MPGLPEVLRRSVPDRLRDDVRLRALALRAGLIPPRRMHSDEDLEVLLEAAQGAQVAVEIGVYEGASAVALAAALGPRAELHLIDPFGEHPDALPRGWGADERATRRTLERALGGRGGPELIWHVALSHQIAAGWSGPAVDLVFIDGDHSEDGCRLDWDSWSPLVAEGGRVVFHDARLGLPGGRGLPGPSEVVGSIFGGVAPSGWERVAEADRTVAVRRVG